MKNSFWKKFFANGYLAVVLAALYLPIVVIIVFSFANNSNFTFDNGFSFDAYVSIFNGPKSEKLLAALENTLILAASASVISTILGTFSTIGIF